MPKANKSTVVRRISEVVRLLLAGAEFAEIRQYASAQQWRVGTRQLRRYMEAAYKRLAQSTHRSRQELLGRHLMQRRALYARSVKDNDLRTALQVLRDEAQLEGLYPTTKNGGRSPNDDDPNGAAANSPFSRRELVSRRCAAEASGDKQQLKLLATATPCRKYILSDTMLPMQMLHTMALIHVNEQLEYATAFLNAMFCGSTSDNDDNAGKWELIAKVSAYRFRIGREAWQAFAKSIGVDHDFLVRSNYEGRMLTFCDERIPDLSPSVEELSSLFDQAGHPGRGLETSEDLCRSWRRMFAEVC